MVTQKEQELFEQEMIEEMKDLENDEAQDSQDESMMNSQEFQEGYGVPEPEQQFNQHSFLANSLNHENPEKVTFLTESELGRPLFNMRFLLDIEDITTYYLEDLFKKYGVRNRISIYFREKIKNIADSGMSNKGFIQRLNVTKNVEMTRKRVRSNSNLNNQKGGNQQQ